MTPLINPPITGGVSTNHKSSNKIELSQIGQDLFDFSDVTCKQMQWWFFYLF